ncbi:MAG: 50S ribosomal protein L28 [Alphaproteobacteria bacterium]
MARRCTLTGKAVLSGNMVSHSNRKTKKRFLPNIQNISVFSDTLGIVKLKISTHALRSIEINGGLDNYLMSKPNTKLSAEAISLKKLIKKSINSSNIE